MQKLAVNLIDWTDYSATASFVDSNTQLLMHLSWALKACGSNDLDNDSYNTDTNGQPAMPISQTLSFNVHSRIKPLAQSTPHKLHIQTNSATSPLKTSSKNRTVSDNSASPLLKGNLLSMNEMKDKDTTNNHSIRGGGEYWWHFSLRGK